MPLALAIAVGACSDGFEDSESPPVNRAPTLTSRSVVTDQNTPLTLNLLEGARDADGDHLTLVSASASPHGVLFFTNGTTTVTPQHDFIGMFSLTYVVSDGQHSVPGSVTVTVQRPDRAPMVFSAVLPVVKGGSVTFTLSGSDPDGDVLSFSIVTRPVSGTLTGAGSSYTYTPAADFTGMDGLTFVASDGKVSSLPGSVVFNVAAPNHPPEANPQSVSTDEDTGVDITLSASDPDGDSLSYDVLVSPTNGTLSGFGASRRFTPFANFHGHDSFTFAVYDGHTNSSVATVSIDVASVNDAPVAFGQDRFFSEDTSLDIELQASDIEGDSLHFDISANPQHGALSGTPPRVTYKPDPDFNGTDTFKFTASDGTATSQEATVTLHLAAVNDAPVALPGSVTTSEDTAVAITLQATDVDSTALTYSIISSPADGLLTGTGANRNYKPAANATGVRSFIFRVSDGSSFSDATVTITITPVNDPPTAVDDYVATDPATELSINVTGNDIDVDGDALTVTDVAAPSHGDVEIVDGHLVYTPDADFTGLDDFTYTIADPSGVSATATVHLGVGRFPTGAPTETITALGISTSDAKHTPSQSEDGRYIAFTTTNRLVPDDTGTLADVYVFDRGTRTYARASVSSSGAQGNGASRNARISANGRYIVFESSATGLVPDDTNGVVDVFRRDRVTGETIRISVATGGAQANGASGDPTISDDGNAVAFSSIAFNLVANDANGASDIFVRDVAAGTTTRVSVSTSGGEADLPSNEPVISGNGKLVAFSSQSTNLVASDSNNVSDVFVRDLVAGTTTRASVSSTGGEANSASTGPSLSRDGRFVSFLTSATNLLPGASGTMVYVRDLQASTTTRPLPNGAVVTARLSGDGRYVAVRDSSSFPGIVIGDRFAASAVMLPGSSNWVFPMFSPSGRYVTVVTFAGSGTLVVAPNPL